MPRTVENAGELFARRAAPGRAPAEGADAVARACHAMAERFHHGGRLLTFGGGGGSTDAQDLASLFLNPGGTARPLPALSSDVGVDDVSARQLGRAGDIAPGLSTLTQQPLGRHAEDRHAEHRHAEGRPA